MAKSREYDTLLVRFNGKWTIQFGSYDPQDVKDELQEHLDCGEWKRKDLKIITTGDKQTAINEAVAKLNGEA